MSEKFYIAAIVGGVLFSVVRTAFESWESVEKVRAEASRPCKCAEVRP